MSTKARTSAGADHYLSDIAAHVLELSKKVWGVDAGVQMVGKSPRMLELHKKIEKVARYREPVLIIGESGVGKELLAQSVYLLSEPSGRPYVSVNCPQYQEGNLTASELFGHRKGSFTGAIADRKGAFESADGGVIFLDEVGDLHMSAQTMLLRTLATGEFKPLGDDRARSADVRVVSATNRPLNQLLLTQEFRHDLFFRLRYFLLEIPPLRERGDDWKLLLDFMLAKLRRKYGVDKRFSPEAMAMLSRYRWPGNVREAVTVATMGYAMSDGNSIRPGDFATQMEGQTLTATEDDAPIVEPVSNVDSANQLLERVRAGNADFWDAIYKPFMERDLNRAQLRSLIQAGLRSAGGSYRRLIGTLHLPPDDYQRFMSFLRHHNLKP